MDERKRRIEWLSSMNKERRLRHEWLSALSESLDMVITESNLLSLKESEQRLLRCCELVQTVMPRLHRVWPIAEQNAVLAGIEGLAVGSTPQDVVLLAPSKDWVCAAVVPLKCVLAQIGGLWRLLDEDVRFTSLDMHHGFALDANALPSPNIELVLWGDMLDEYLRLW